MSEKDKAEKVLEDYNDVFADIYNTLLFEELFLEEDKLEYGSIESIYKAEQGELHEQRRDVLKTYRDAVGLVICSLGMENQSMIDQYMPVRVMGYDYAAYRNLLKNEKTLTPVITIVLNFSDKRWDGPKSLHELLNLTEEMKDYVQDYKIVVYDIAFLEDEVIENFRSDFKVIAKFFKKKRLGLLSEVMEDNEVALKHVEATLDLLKVFTNDNRYAEVYTNELKERVEKGEGITMCNVLDYYEQRGIEQGELRMLLTLVSDGDLSIEKAAEKAKLTVEEFSALLGGQKQEA